jgi:hypothetical protein
MAQVFRVITGRAGRSAVATASATASQVPTKPVRVGAYGVHEEGCPLYKPPAPPAPAPAPETAEARRIRELAEWLRGLKAEREADGRTQVALPPVPPAPDLATAIRASDARATRKGKKSWET